VTGSSPAQPVKVGLLSFAHVHATAYARILQDRADVELLTTDPGPHPGGEGPRGRDLAQALGVAYVESREELYAWGPAAVVIAAENTARPALVVEAAAHGSSILTEKPLATTDDDAASLTRLVTTGSTQLVLALPVRHASDFARLQQAYQDGELGEIVAVQAVNTAQLPRERGWFTDEALAGGGALMDHLVHVADLVEQLTGERAVSVTAAGHSLLHPHVGSVETAGLASIRYSSGMIVSVDCSWSVPESAPTWGGLSLHVVGTRGVVDVDFFRPRLRGSTRRSGLPLELPYGEDLDAVLIDRFLAVVRGQVPAVPDATGGERAVALITAAQESARSGRTVHLAAAGAEPR
jgi:1,5-anhydro-D-fructose reductase (1,5-anhydro-D-mannitol-forming)